MSDARNSSGNLRGGGSKQTGGTGRTSKHIGSGGTSRRGLPSTSLTAHHLDKKQLARRNLQMITLSKQLALEARKTCFQTHSEDEFIELDVPTPDPESALKKLKAMTKFTDDWFDAQFRERFLRDVLEIWNKELLAEFEEAARIAKENAEARERWESEKKKKEEENGGVVEQQPQQEGVSTEELEARLEDVTLSAEDRKKIKKKLKKRKQKANKKKNTTDDENAIVCVG